MSQLRSRPVLLLQEGPAAHEAGKHVPQHCPAPKLGGEANHTKQDDDECVEGSDVEGDRGLRLQRLEATAKGVDAPLLVVPPRYLAS